MKGTIETILLLVLAVGFIAFLIGLYFLPTLVAMSKCHIDTLAIFLVNLFTGWTFIGWLGSLIWAIV